jgi:hypothetical protein
MGGSPWFVASRIYHYTTSQLILSRDFSKKNAQFFSRNIVQNYLLHFRKIFGIIIIVNEREITNGIANNFQIYKKRLDKVKIKCYNKYNK